jgi:UDP-N-acetylmuramate dehydrogenase
MENLPRVNGPLFKHKSLAPYSWFKVGGDAEYLYVPSSVVDLTEFYRQVPTEMPVTIIGNLSNTLVRDGGVKGFVVKLSNSEFKYVKIDRTEVEVGAGMINRNLCLEACKKGLSGLEFLTCIPGSIGGAIKMNAGAYGSEIKDVLVSCRVMDSSGEIKNLKAKDILFGYRKSSIRDELMIVSATFKCTRKPKAEIAKTMEEMLEKRKDTQPGKEKTGGSTFKNPEGDKAAWQLIDEAGLRGYSIGGAKISEKHTNFIVNYDNANAKDIESLIDLAKVKVYEKTGIMLESEIKIIGEF